MGIKTFASQSGGGGERRRKQKQMEIICPLKFIHCLQPRIYFSLQDCQHFRGILNTASRRMSLLPASQSSSIFTCFNILTCPLPLPKWFCWNLWWVQNQFWRKKLFFLLSNQHMRSYEEYSVSNTNLHSLFHIWKSYNTLLQSLQVFKIVVN